MGVPEEHAGLLVPGQTATGGRRLFDDEEVPSAVPRTLPARGSNRFIFVASAIGTFLISMTMLVAFTNRSSASAQSPAFRPVKVTDYTFDVKVEEAERDPSTHNAKKVEDEQEDPS